MRREAAKLGFVLRDEGTRQYFFLSDTD
ncbi:CysS/YqeB C-terminal domain-containing protein [Paenibacillus larvae]